MQKILTIIVFSFISSFIYGQFPETFEGGSFPPPNWLAFDNGIGLGYAWQATEDAHYGESAAFIRWEDVDTSFAEDWFVSPQFTVSADAPVLSFFQKQEFVTEYYSQYTVRVSSVSQSNPTDFIVVDEQDENDLELFYTLHEVDLSDYIGRSIYVAFVMANDDGDNWFIDDIDFPRCSPPNNLQVANITGSGADLQWTDATGVSWDIEVVGTGEPPTGVPNIVGLNSTAYTWTAGDPLALYDFYVRAACGDGTYSNFNGPTSFNTSCGTEACDYLFVLSDAYGDDWNDAYIEIKQNGITIAQITQVEFGFGPYTIPISLCSDVDVELIWHSGSWDQECIFEFYDGWDQIYYSFGAGESPEDESVFYTGKADCSPVTCRFPYDLISTDYLSNGATFSWTEKDNATAWDLEIVQHGATPTGNPTLEGVTDNPYRWTGGEPGSNYEVYVRAACSTDDASLWSQPSVFSTRCDVQQSIYPFVEDFSAVPLLPVCWTSINQGAGNKSWVSKMDTRLEDTIAVCEHEFADQDVWLLSPEFNFSGLVHVNLTFNWKLSYYWMVYPYDKGDLNLYASTDGGATWTSSLWSEESEGEFASFEWITTEIPLNAFAGEESVLFAFQSRAKDASTVYLDNFSIIEDPGISAVQVVEKSFLEVYPIPAQDQLYLKFNQQKAQDVKIQLNDITNTLMYADIVHANSGDNIVEIDISGYPSGVYLLQIYVDQGIDVRKIVVE